MAGTDYSTSFTLVQTIQLICGDIGNPELAPGSCRLEGYKHMSKDHGLRGKNNYIYKRV